MDEFGTWTVKALKDFCSLHGLSASGKNKAELTALAYAVVVMDVPESQKKKDELLSIHQEYNKLLNLPIHSIPDPLDCKNDGSEYKWQDESNGMQLWPCLTSSDIITFFNAKDETQNTGRMFLTQYKLGKAYEYFCCKWIKEIETCKFKNYIMLRSQCTPSQRVNSENHRIWALLTEMGEICVAYCTCVAGLHQTCNHVAGMLFRVEFAVKHGITSGKSSTSLLCQWTVPSKKTDVQPLRVKDMNFVKAQHSRESQDGIFQYTKRPTVDCGGRAVNVIPTTSDEWSKLVQDVNNKSCFIANTKPCTFTTSSRESQVNSPPTSAHLDLINLTKTSYSNECLNLPIPSDEDVQVICEITNGQSENDNWKLARRGRITASIFHEVNSKAVKLKNGGGMAINCQNIVTKILQKESRNLDNIPAIVYGRKMEEEAKKKYTSLQTKNGHQNLSIENCGLFLHRKHTFIGASPDLLVSCSCCGTGVVEIKCPYTNMLSSPANQPPQYMPQLSLKRNHAYFAQVQGQMGVTERKYCDFFVFSKQGFVLQRMYFDKNYWQQLEENIVYFFHNTLLGDILRY